MVLKAIDKQLISIRKFDAWTYSQALKQLFLFPYDYFLRKGKSTMPLNIALFLTLRCNARCSMCNLQDILNKDNREFSLEQIENLLKQIGKYKPSIVLFGGEPLLRRDFSEIVKMMKKYKLSCGIFTNGTLFNNLNIKEIVKNKMNFVAFSMQGIGKTHDKIVGLNNAFDKMIKAIREFQKYKNKKTKIIIHTTISEQNLDELGKIVELGEKLKVDLIRFGHPTFFTKSDVEKNKKIMKAIFPDEKIEEISYFYEPEENGKKFYEKIAEFMRKYKGRMKMTPDLDFKEIKNWYSNDFKTKRKCFFVYRGLFIYPNGDVIPCESFKFIMGNINQQKFKYIWNSEKYVKFRRELKKKLYPACARCCKL